MLATSATIMLPVVPSGSHHQPNGKRKAIDAEANPLVAAAKRLKKDKSTSNKRKPPNAEETPSGLLIVRAPPPQDSSFSVQPIPSSSDVQYPPRLSSSQPISRTSPSPFKTPSSSQPPPSKKFRASSAQPSSRHHKYHGAPSPIPEEADVEAAIQAMNDEADSLLSNRRQSRIPTVMDQNLDPAFQFPPPERSGRGHKLKGKAREILMDVSAPLEQEETPQIQKNKRLREGAMAAITANGEEGDGDERPGRDRDRRTNHRRRSSLSRGKRISSGFDLTGIISSPHNSVSETNFYKHIDCDLPDSERLRQLLIWCTIRASGSTTFSSSSTPSKPHSTASLSSAASKAQLPPLSDKAQEVLRTVQDDLVRKLAERKVDLSLYGGGSQTGAEAELNGETLKENEQNSKNKDFEVKYSQQIRQLEQEEDQWKKVSYRYDEYIRSFTQAMEKRAAAALSTKSAMSEKAKGKQKSIEEEEEILDELLPDLHDLPSDLRRSLDLVRTTLSLRSPSSSSTKSHPSSSKRPITILTTHRGASLSHEEVISTITKLIPDVTYKLDGLHTFVSAARVTTRVVEEMLNERFRLLVENLEQRRVGGNLDSGHATGSRGGGGGSLDVVKNCVQREVPPLYVQDTMRGATSISAGPGGLKDLMRALSRIDTARPPSQIGDSVRRAAREVQRIGESNGGSGFGDMKLTAVYPAVGVGGGGNGNGGSGGVMTPRKMPGTPRRHGTPGRERERTPKR